MQTLSWLVKLPARADGCQMPFGGCGYTAPQGHPQRHPNLLCRWGLLGDRRLCQPCCEPLTGPAQVCDTVTTGPGHEHGVCLRAGCLLHSLATGTGRIVPVACPQPLLLHPHGHCGHPQGLHTPKPCRQQAMPHTVAPESSLTSPLLSSCPIQHPSLSTGIQAGVVSSAQPVTQVPKQLRAAAGTSLHSLPHPHQKLGSSWGMRGSCRPCKG